MPPPASKASQAAAQQPRQPPSFKRSRKGQDPDIAKRLKHSPFIKSLKDQEKLLYDFENSLDELEETKATLQEERARTQILLSRNKKLTEDLTEKIDLLQDFAELNGNLKEDLLKRQPASQVADSKIADQYSNLQQNISSWVDGEVRRFEKQYKSDHGGSYPHFNVFRYGGIPGQAQFLEAEQRFGGEYMVESYVQYELGRLLFGEAMIFFALDTTEAIFMKTVEEGLQKLDPPKDDPAVRQLRSDVLKGFITSKLFYKRREQWMSDIGKGILNRTENMLPKAGSIMDTSRRAEAFRKRILEPAFDLAVAMKTSSTRYGLSETMTEQSRLKQVVLKYYHVPSSKIINIDTREALRINNTVHNDDDTIGAKQVLLVAPGLLRYNDPEPALRLTNDVICAKVHTPASALAKAVVVDDDGNKQGSSCSGSSATVASVTLKDDEIKPEESDQEGTNEIKVEDLDTNPGIQC
ncbi:MAG: hypothetical protein Q9205_006884 [Flavoplaca limonia]